MYSACDWYDQPITFSVPDVKSTVTFYSFAWSTGAQLMIFCFASDFQGFCLAD